MTGNQLIEFLTNNDPQITKRLKELNIANLNLQVVFYDTINEGYYGISEVSKTDHRFIELISD
jgi:hypothetical protein